MLIKMILFEDIFLKMFNQNRIYRLFQLINYLKARPAKSMRSIEAFLETSERTAYRYLDLLKELGFEIQKDGNNKMYIAALKDADYIPFTPQETDYLKKLILSSGKNHLLAESALHKIYQSGEAQQAAESIFKTHLSKMVELLSQGILEGKQVLIKGYSSANSQSIRNRLVEPVCFTENYDAISAFEIESMENKYFNIERMRDVEVTNKAHKNGDLHAYYKPDIFGFQGKNMQKEIEWNMSLRASLLLKEEYPMSAGFIHHNPQDGRYHFKAEVQSFKAPARFVLGFTEEIKVTGSKEFVKHLNKNNK